MRILIAILAVAATSVAACSRGEEKNVCTRNTAYLEAGSANPLSVPDDLSLPDESDALRIPEEVAVVNGQASNVECLEYSPAFGTAEPALPDG